MPVLSVTKLIHTHVNKTSLTREKNYTDFNFYFTITEYCR